MIADEEGHLSWVWNVLEKQSNSHKDGLVTATMKRVEAIDMEVSNKLISKSPFDEYFGDMYEADNSRCLAITG